MLACGSDALTKKLLLAAREGAWLHLLPMMLTRVLLLEHFKNGGELVLSPENSKSGGGLNSEKKELTDHRKICIVMATLLTNALIPCEKMLNCCIVHLDPIYRHYTTLFPTRILTLQSFSK